MNLSPFAFCDEDEALRYLRRKGVNPADYDNDAIEDSINRAVAWLEGPNGTARRLAWRVYREAVSAGTCTLTASSRTVTGTGFTSLYAGDELVGTGLAPGTRILSIESATSLTLDRPAVTAGSVTLTAGSERLVANGTGTANLYVPEWPVTQIIGAWSRETDGTLTTLDTTGAFVRDASSGLISLPEDVFPEGDSNIVLSLAAGYRRPSGSVRGDWRDWFALQNANLRAAQVFLQDWSTGAGRASNKAVGSLGVAVQDYEMPADIRAIARAYARVG